MCVNSDKKEHQEKANAPELGKRNHSCGLRVGDEGQPWTCEGEGALVSKPPEIVQMDLLFFLPESTTVSTVTL